MEKKKYPFTESEVKAAYNTSIIDIVQQYGYELEAQKDVFKVKQMGGLYIWSNGLGWYHHTGDYGKQKGNNVDFLLNFCNISSKTEAIRLLLDYSRIIPSAEINIPKIEKEKKEFKLPEKNRGPGGFKRVMAYLIGTRKIDKDIVYRMINEKKLYEDFRHNCVFVAYDTNGNPRYAAQRGTVTNLPPGVAPFKGDVLGSEKYPFVIQGKPESKRVFVFEAPIEAMSHATIFKLGGKDYTEDNRISIGGLSPKALERYLNVNQQIKQIVFCLNNDYDAVNPVTGEIDNHGQKATVNLAKHFFGQGYDIRKSTPQMPNRDWNDQLKSYYEPQNEVKIEEEVQAEAPEPQL